MRQVSIREFRLKGSEALGKVQPGEAVILSGRSGPAFFLIPAQGGAMDLMEEELKAALAMSSLREGWRRAKESGLDQLSLEEINAEIRLARKERGKKRPARKTRA